MALLNNASGLIPSCFSYLGNKTKPPANTINTAASILYLKDKNLTNFLFTMLCNLSY